MNLLIADDEAVIRRGLLSLDWKMCIRLQME